MTNITCANIVTNIARANIPGIETLETRNLDSLDFHDISVGCLKDALEAAFKAGQNAEKFDREHLSMLRKTVSDFDAAVRMLQRLAARK